MREVGEEVEGFTRSSSVLWCCRCALGCIKNGVGGRRAMTLLVNLTNGGEDRLQHERKHEDSGPQRAEPRAPAMGREACHFLMIAILVCGTQSRCVKLAHPSTMITWVIPT